MSRLPLVDPEEMTQEQRAQYDRFPSNLTRGLLLTEQRLAGALPSTANALPTSGLDPKLREGVILRVAALSDWDPTAWWTCLTLARKVFIDGEDTSLLCAGVPAADGRAGRA